MFNTKQLLADRHISMSLTAALRAERAFWDRADNLKAANKVLLRFVLKHPAVTDVPGFDTLFHLCKVVLSQLPQRWFVAG
jgi:hypothetical protein